MTIGQSRLAWITKLRPPIANSLMDDHLCVYMEPAISQIRHSPGKYGLIMIIIIGQFLPSSTESSCWQQEKKAPQAIMKERLESLSLKEGWTLMYWPIRKARRSLVVSIGIKQQSGQHWSTTPKKRSKLDVSPSRCRHTTKKMVLEKKNPIFSYPDAMPAAGPEAVLCVMWEKPLLLAGDEFFTI